MIFGQKSIHNLLYFVDKINEWLKTLAWLFKIKFLKIEIIKKKKKYGAGLWLKNHGKRACKEILTLGMCMRDHIEWEPVAEPIR